MGLFKKEEKKEAPKVEKEPVTESERLEKGQVLCRFIVEILGKPKDHVEATIKTYVEKIKEDKEYFIVKEDYAETQEKGEGLFACFVELELWAKTISKVIEFCFDYMPSSVEIIEPDRFSFDSSIMAGLLNDLQAKLHRLDMAVKNLRTENKILNENATNLLRNTVIIGLKGKELTLTELSDHIGISKDQLKPFMEAMVKAKRVEVKEEKYKLR